MSELANTNEESETETDATQSKPSTALQPYKNPSRIDRLLGRDVDNVRRSLEEAVIDADDEQTRTLALKNLDDHLDRVDERVRSTWTWRLGALMLLVVGPTIWPLINAKLGLALMILGAVALLRPSGSKIDALLELLGKFRNST